MNSICKYINNKNKKINLISNFIVICSFVLLSIFNVMIVWHGNILNGNDLYFHLERFNELIRSNELFPRFALNSFSYNGSSIMTMYPYLFLYPFAILSKIIGVHFTAIIYIMFIINSLITFMVSYYCSLSFNNRGIISYIFSLMYTISYQFIAINFWSCDLGMAWSVTFMPLVVFGFIYWIRNNKWQMLSLGVSCIIYSNITIAFLTPLLLILWSLFYLRKLTDRAHVINLFKSILMTILITSMFWLPAFKLYMFNKLSGAGHLQNLEGTTNLFLAFLSTFNIRPAFLFNNGWFPWELTIYATMGLLLSLIYYKNLDYYTRRSMIFSLFILLVICTHIFPWRLKFLLHAGGIFQTTTRMYLIPQVILTYIFACYIYKFLRNKKYKYKLFPVIILIMIFQVLYANAFNNQRQFSHKNGIFRSEYLYSKSHVNSKEGLYLSKYDYYIGPYKSRKLIVNLNGISNNNDVVHFNPLGNGHFKFHINKRMDHLSIPFLHYNKQSYRCYLDKKLVKSYSNDDNLVTINHISPGYHTIHVIIPLTRMDIVSRLLTLIGVLVYLNIVVIKIRNEAKL